MKLICMLSVCLAIIGCEYRDLTEYSLDPNSFDSEAMEKIEREVGIDLPDEAIGLAFLHLPPMDPIVFAKIQLPATAQDSIAKQIEVLSSTHFQEDFANDRCQWWPETPKEVILSKQAFNNG